MNDRPHRGQIPVGLSSCWGGLPVSKLETIKEAFSRIARNAKEILKKRSVSFREIHDGETQGKEASRPAFY